MEKQIRLASLRKALQRLVGKRRKTDGLQDQISRADSATANRKSNRTTQKAFDMNKKCKKCNTEFAAPDDPVLNHFTPFCPVCATAQLEAAAAVERRRRDHVREVRWQSLCPPAFRDTLLKKLPHPSKAAEILAWNYSKTGLLLHGKTRQGKSRCAWLLVRKVFESGKSIQVLDSMAGFQYAAAFSNSGREAQAWVEARCCCGLLFFDDVFKVKLTTRLRRPCLPS